MKRLFPLAVCAAVLCAAAPALADPGPETQITETTVGGVTTRSAQFPAVAVHPRTGESFVAFDAQTAASGSSIGVFVQRTGADGARVGAPIRVSADGDGLTLSSNPPEIAYSAVSDEFLVTWDDDHVVYARRLATDGTPLGGRITVSAGWTDIETTVPVYNAQAGQWYVVFKGIVQTIGRGSSSTTQQVYGQRLDVAGTKVGPVFNISNLTSNADDAIDVAYAPDSGRMLVVEHGIHAASPGFTEIYGQLLGSDGAQIGDIIEVSSMDGDAAPPRAGYDTNAHRFLVAWSGEDDADPNVPDLYGQFLSADGAPIGTDDFRITHVGTTDTDSAVSRPDLAFNPVANEWLLAWHGEYLTSEVQKEVYAQRLSPDGAAIGGVSQLTDADPDDDTDLESTRPSVAYNSVTCDWSLAYTRKLASDTEVFGRRWLSTGCPVPPAAAPAATQPAPTVPVVTPPKPKPPVLSLTLSSSQRIGSNGYITLRAGCQGPCTIATGATISVPGAAKVFRVGTKKTTLKKAGKVTIKLKLGKKARAAVKRALKRKRKVTAKVTIAITDSTTKLTTRTARKLSAKR
jgi:hypothetical protein